MPKEHPIIMKTEMVIAYLEGRKTQTRRLVRPDLYNILEEIKKVNGRYVIEMLDFDVPCPFGQVGDKIWWKETWALREDGKQVITKSQFQILSDVLHLPPIDIKWTTPYFMPRWACQIVTEITGLRIERLQDISEDDAVAEGVLSKSGMKEWERHKFSFATRTSPKDEFQCLWDKLYGERVKYADNPLVWVIQFPKCAEPITITGAYTSRGGCYGVKK